MSDSVQDLLEEDRVSDSVQDTLAEDRVSDAVQETRLSSEKERAGSPAGTLIVFEEVDILPEDDRGFMAALAGLIPNSKVCIS